jgi:hypothetical protein
VSVFEQNAAAREKLMVSLLAAFDARTWVSISGIVLRLVKGGGFGQAWPTPPIPALAATQQDMMHVTIATIAVLQSAPGC